MDKNQIIIEQDSEKLMASFSSTDIQKFTSLDKRYLSDFLTYLKNMYYRSSYNDLFKRSATHQVEFEFFSDSCYLYLGDLQTTFLFKSIDNGFKFEHFIESLKSVIPNYEDYLQ